MANATSPGKTCQIFQRRFNSPKHDFRALNAGIRGNAGEQPNEIALGIERSENRQSSHLDAGWLRISAVALEAFGNDFFDRLLRTFAFGHFSAGPLDGLIQRMAIAIDEIVHFSEMPFIVLHRQHCSGSTTFGGRSNFRFFAALAVMAPFYLADVCRARSFGLPAWQSLPRVCNYTSWSRMALERLESDQNFVGRAGGTAAGSRVADECWEKAKRFVRMHIPRF